VTTFGYIVGLLAMGLYSYFKTVSDVSNFKFIPVTSLSLVIFSASIGRLPLTYIMMAEIMPQSIRSFGVSISTTFNWILAFILLRYFSTFVNLLKFHACMFTFCGFAAFGMFFVIFYVPETKSKSFEEIENSLTRRNLKYSAAKDQEEEDRV
jgi:Sugar (and other) transporter